MSINFATLRSLSIPEGVVTQITDASGRVLWSAMKKVKVTITSLWGGMDGDTASITVNSSTPFAPDPLNPSYKTKTWTVSVYDEPNCTIEIPVGSTIECAVSRDKGNADSYIKMNGSKVVTGEGTYIYTVTGDVTVTIEDKYSQGDYGVITILEAEWVENNVVVLDVEKITSDTYAGSTTYTGEEFILLDIYPKTNGTVNVTYGGLTKTITDTSGAEEPNAQEVFFGTYNGVSDSVTTPSSGELTIEGDYVAFGCASYNVAKMSYKNCACVTAIHSFGKAEYIPNSAFGGASGSCDKLEKVVIPSSMQKIDANAFSGCNGLTSVIIKHGLNEIGGYAFLNCGGLSNIDIPNSVTIIDSQAFGNTGLTDVIIPESVTTINGNPWSNCTKINSMTVASGNKAYKMVENCLIEIASDTIVSGLLNTIIPSTVKIIDLFAFSGNKYLTNVTIPSGVTTVGGGAFGNCENLQHVTVPASVTSIESYLIVNSKQMKSITFIATTPPTLLIATYLSIYNETADDGTVIYYYPTIVVPKGCGETYKTAEIWSGLADYIVEAS